MPKIIDWQDLINRLEDEELIIEIVPEFLQNDHQYIEQISAALTAGDTKQLQMSAHTLKGAAATVGAVALSQKAKALELLAEELNLDHAQPLLEEIKTELDKVREFLTNPNWPQIAKADIGNDDD